MCKLSAKSEKFARVPLVELTWNDPTVLLDWSTETGFSSIEITVPCRSDSSC